MTTYTGGCLCGSIRYTATGEPSRPHYCSCKMCQQWSGAPVVAWVDFPRNALSWDGPGGEPSVYRSSEMAKRGFCTQCGGTLFALDDGADTICMTTATLDNPDSHIPESHSFADAAPAWLHVTTKATSNS